MISQNILLISPVFSPQVQNDILRTVLPNIENQLASYQIVEYNPVGVLDGSLEKLSLTEIPMFEFI